MLPKPSRTAYGVSCGTGASRSAAMTLSCMLTRAGTRIRKNVVEAEKLEARVSPTTRAQGAAEGAKTLDKVQLAVATHAPEEKTSNNTIIEGWPAGGKSKTGFVRAIVVESRARLRSAITGLAFSGVRYFALGTREETELTRPDNCRLPGPAPLVPPLSEAA